MLSITSVQMQLFAQAFSLRFEDEMLAHGKMLSPQLCEVIGDEQARAAVRAALESAQAHGFTSRGPLQLYVDMTFLCGSAFDTDPQYSQVGDLLRLPVHQMQRAQQLHDFSNNYLERVCGPDNAYVRRALKELLLFARNPLTIRNEFAMDMLDELIGIFPEKALFLGGRRLSRLIDAAIDLSQQRGWSDPRHQALLAALMFMFGHGCLSDPLCPWIGRMASDQPVDPAIQAAHLTWFEYVLMPQPAFPT